MWNASHHRMTLHQSVGRLGRTSLLMAVIQGRERQQGEGATPVCHEALHRNNGGPKCTFTAGFLLHFISQY